MITKTNFGILILIFACTLLSCKTNSLEVMDVYKKQLVYGQKNMQKEEQTAILLKKKKGVDIKIMKVKLNKSEAGMSVFQNPVMSDTSFSKSFLSNSQFACFGILLSDISENNQSSEQATEGKSGKIIYSVSNKIDSIFIPEIKIIKTERLR